jgi:hypothetical protein
MNIDHMSDGVQGTDRRHTKRDPVREAMSLQNNWAKGSECQGPNGQK